MSASGFGPSGGTKLCPMCAKFVPIAQPTCGNCGYDFESGTGGGGSAGGDIPTPHGVIADSGAVQAAKSQRGLLFVVIWVLVLASVGVAGYLTFRDLDVGDMFSSDGGGDPSVPDFDVDFDTDFGFNVEGPGVESAAECSDLIFSEMAKLLTKRAFQDLGPPFIRASERLGAATFEYRTLIDVFSRTEVNGEFITGSRKKALSSARRLTERACAREY